MDAAAIAVVNTGAGHLKAASVSLRAKLVNMTLALDSTRFLRKETEYIPWEAATRNLRNFVLMFQHTEAFGPLQACVTNPAQPHPPHPSKINPQKNSDMKLRPPADVPAEPSGAPVRLLQQLHRQLYRPPRAGLTVSTPLFAPSAGSLDCLGPFSNSEPPKYLCVFPVDNKSHLLTQNMC